MLQRLLSYASQARDETLKNEIKKIIAQNFPEILGKYYKELAGCTLTPVANSIDLWDIMLNDGKRYGSLSLSSGLLVISDPSKQKQYSLPLPPHVVENLKSKEIFSEQELLSMRCHVQNVEGLPIYYISNERADSPLFLRFSPSSTTQELS